MLFFASINPLFEWQISEVVTDFPSSYKVQIMSHSPWKAYLGESLNDKSYVFQKFSVWENGEGCSINDINILVNRSQKDAFLERLSLTRQFNYDNHDWIIMWILIEIALSVAYSLWFTIWHDHRPVSDVIISVVFFTICFCFILMPAMRVMGHKIGFFSGIANCHGTISFSAKLSKMYYSMIILLFIGIVAELTALAVMARQIAMTASKSKESSG
jgi:hypothetical protein